ncbi:immunoglobulin superfamily member 5-like [Megalops cyprinoides]|uniref:immunoglobulin superfamily member 5-like n=1 Tax=Megalops cyprinoides TaxID=118141 RepID=UPI001864C322|nr:immunoglobulin superfamily member 5-like [Megalops cyprinoides]
MTSILLAFLLLPAIGGVIAQVQLEPENAAILRGTDARFNCSLSQSWVAMTWFLNSNYVLTITREHGPISNDGRYTAVNRSTDQSSKWEFILKNAQLNDSGLVSCEVQNVESKRANLSVQESGTVTILSGNVTAKRGQQATFQCLAQSWFPEPLVTWTFNGTDVDKGNYNTSSVASGGLFSSTSTLSLPANHSAPVECLATVPALSMPQTSSVFLLVVPETPQRDQTVLIAVIVSVVAFALLVLLVIGIVFCCKRRKAAKSNYQEEVRKTRSINEKSATAGAAQGKDNLAYSPDGQTGVAYSEFNDSGFSQTNSIRTIEMPDVVSTSYSAANGHGHDTLTADGIRKHRHATIV